MKVRTLTVAGMVAMLALVGCAKQESNAKSPTEVKPQAQAQTQAQSQTETNTAPVSSEDAGAVKAAGLLALDQSPMAPDWTLPGVDGANHSLSQYRGKVVILDFWDTWCPPCKREIPGFIELQKKYEDEGLVVIGAAFGRDGQGAVEQFVKEWEMNYPVVVANSQVNRSYGGINSIPTTFVIDRQGRARAKHVGYVEKAVFEQQVKALL